MSPEDNNRDERLFELGESLGHALRAGESVRPEQWAKRYDLELEDVEAALRALEGLRPGAEAGAGRPPASPFPQDLQAPKLPADLAVRGELGRGGMGVVWRAHQVSLDRDVAVKVLMPTEIVFGAALERFQREAKSLARLRHRHIVRIHDVGTSDGHLYFVMDLIEGESLAAALKRGGAMNPARAVRLLRQVASAIAYVHERGIVHRDLKPANILIDGDGDAYVVDFGLALDRTAATDLTVTGHLLGTPAYMAPEQIRGDRALIGETSDIYAMGAILYECLEGKAPFAGLGLMDLVQSIERREPLSLMRTRSSVPLPLARIAHKAMAKSPADRYPTARALLEDLERFEAGARVLAEPPSVMRGLGFWTKRHRTTLAAILVSVIVTALALSSLRPDSPGPEIPAVLRAARTMAANGEAAASRLLLRQALDEGAALDDGELQAALAQKLVSGDEDVHRRIRVALEEQDSAKGRADSSWKLLHLASRQLEGRGDARPIQADEEIFLDRAGGWTEVLDAFVPAWLGADHQTWSEVAVALLQTRLAKPLIGWMSRQGHAADQLLLLWVEDGALTRSTLQPVLGKCVRTQEFMDHLSERGAAALPGWIRSIDDPNPAVREAARHIACAITGFPGSPWSGRIGVATALGPEELTARLTAWSSTSPAEWDLELLRWMVDLSGSPQRTREAWSGLLFTRYGSDQLVNPLPASAAELSQRMHDALGLTGTFESMGAADLQEQFLKAKSSMRAPLQRLLAHKLGRRTPLWPALETGYPGPEPTSLASDWYRLVAEESGTGRDLGFRVRWAWFDATEPAEQPLLIEQDAQVVMPGRPFFVRALRDVEGTAWRTPLINGGFLDKAPPPALLWQSVKRPAKPAEVLLTGRVELPPGGPVLHFEPLPGDSGRAGPMASFVAGAWRGLAPETTEPLMKYRHSDADGEEVLEIFAARLDLPHTALPEWLDSNTLDHLRSRYLEIEQGNAAPARAASTPKTMSPQRKWIVRILLAFLGVSALFGIVDGFRRARRAEVSVRIICRRSAQVMLGVLMGLLILLVPLQQIPRQWVAPILLVASACAWLSVPTSSRSWAARAPAVLWLAAAALTASATSFGGGNTAFAWATLLWPLGALIGGVTLEAAAWRLGLGQPLSSLVLLTVLAVYFGDGLLSGLILTLETAHREDSLALARWLTEARANSTLVQLQFALRSAPLATLLFHATWWTLTLRLHRYQRERSGQ
ncbi:Serine/threonine-protein kinase StkP [Planctomycetes bacterium Poly30]|uniref:Serine/threonine-protein kinase StkP n=1 Tax=Saltatorellus ferox TaxID=2528018 RepID=A0A518EQR0_9BACT|nr:Serine/threonine-protein kinase StkP [Planctomycetes bacterium Poly30]